MPLNELFLIGKKFWNHPSRLMSKEQGIPIQYNNHISTWNYTYWIPYVQDENLRH